MKEAFVGKKFNPEHTGIIQTAEDILVDYAAQGYDLTLRQLYYQFVARDLLPNTQQSYKRLGGIINDARLAGLIDWEHIVDRTRNLQALSHWTTPGSMIYSAASSYHIDLWKDIKYKVEVWVEKDALIGVVGRACNALDVAYFSSRGYGSQSEMYRAAKRLDGCGKTPVIIHLSDHDPSGIDMSRDIRERLETFGVFTIFKRVALTMEQVEQYGPPPNPAKVTDSRAKGYIKEYGTESWELDALEPAVLEALIESEIDNYLDGEIFNRNKIQKQTEKKLLFKVSENWDRVKEML